MTESPQWLGLGQASHKPNKHKNTNQLCSAYTESPADVLTLHGTQVRSPIMLSNILLPPTEQSIYSLRRPQVCSHLLGTPVNPHRRAVVTPTVSVLSPSRCTRSVFPFQQLHRKVSTDTVYSSEPYGYTTKPRITMAVHAPRSVFPPSLARSDFAKQKYSSEPHGYTNKPRITMAVHVPRSVFPFV